MTVLKRLLAAALVASVSVATACSDAVGPDDVDAEQMAADVAALANVFESNAAYTSLQSLSLLLPSFAASPVRTAMAPLARMQRVGTRPTSIRALMRPLADVRVSASRVPIFPQDVVGHTLVWNATTDQYEVGTTVGAPANGIRVLLYVIDPNSGVPFEPVQQIGFVDLTDEAPNPALSTRLGVLVSALGTPLADYYVDLRVTTANITMQGVGYLRSADALRQADFDLTSSEAIQGTGNGIDFLVTGSDGTFISLDAEGTATTAVLDFTVGRGENSIRLMATEGSDTVDGEILFNGTAVATISGASDNPVIQGANGYQLTDEELEAVGGIFGISLLFVLLLTLGVFGPAAVLFGL